MRFALPVPVEPLLPEHSEECRQESGEQCRIENALNLNDNGIGASPARYMGRGTGSEGSGCGIEEHLK